MPEQGDTPMISRSTDQENILPITAAVIALSAIPLALEYRKQRALSATSRTETEVR